MEILDQCIRLSSEHAANSHLLRRCYRVDVAFLPKYVLLASDREFGEGDKDGDGATDALALPPLCPAKIRGIISLQSTESDGGLRERLLT
jgi:hypothetical protein